MTRSNSFRHSRSRTNTRLLYKKPKPVSDYAFDLMIGSMYEGFGAQAVTGMVILSGDGTVGIFDADNLCYDPFWLINEPCNPRNIEDYAIITVYGRRDRCGDFYEVAHVVKHPPGSKVYEEVHAL